MSYYAKDCLFLFFIGLIPSLIVKGGPIAWGIICLTRYLLIKTKRDKFEKNLPQTKEEFDKRGKERGYKVADHLFDENGNIKRDRFN